MVVDRAAESFAGIRSAIEGTEGQAREIFELTEQQREAARKVQVALAEISQVARRNTEGTVAASDATQEQIGAMQAMNASAQELAETSDHLKQAISVFRVN